MTNQKLSNHIELGIFSEDFYASNVMLDEVDGREFLFSINKYIPCSSLNLLIWQDLDVNMSEVSDIIDKGDLIVNKEIAEIIMSFDPFGVEFYPIALKCKDGILKDRYLLSVNSIIDVIDYESSEIIKNPKPNRDPIVSSIAISPEKLIKIPLYKRLAFRIKGATTSPIIFDGSIIKYLIPNMNKYFGAKITPFNTSELVPSEY